MINCNWYLVIGWVVFCVGLTYASKGEANSVEQVEGCVFVSHVAEDDLELKRAMVGRGKAIEQLTGAYRSSPPSIVKHLVDGVYKNIGSAVQPRDLGDRVFAHCLTLEIVKEYDI
ncbi:MAG: hypothetical protein JKY52_14495 [Flavobacteriales bacterium]|nr:hypothetical protein [Flavobacteriales bacterium]